MDTIDTNVNAPPDAPEVEIDRLRAQVRNEHEKYLRSLAEFDNYRRRVEREMATASERGKRDLILGLFDVMDAFDLALQHMKGAPPAVLDGVNAIYRKMFGLLEAQGVTAFNSLGQRFDPELHEAIGVIAATGYEPGIVLDEVQRGYRWRGEVLRPSRVRVAQKP